MWYSKLSTVTIEIHDEISCVIHGLDREHAKFFSDSYAMFTANYFFNPKYKLGAWDGKIRFFTTGGNTYVYLLEEIIPTIKKLGYKIKLDDHRTTSFLQPEPITADRFSHLSDKFGNPLMFRDYQIRLVNKLIAQGYGLGLAATGAGKTFMTAGLLDAYEQVGGTSFVIVPSTTLVKQTREDLQGWGLSVGEFSGDHKLLDFPHVVSTWQALQNNPKVMSDRDVIIVDECHGAKANVLKNIISQAGKNIPHRFGLTGTLPKDKCDQLSIKVMLGSVVDEIPAKELIDQGFLATLDITMHQMIEDLTKQFAKHKADYPDLDYKTFKKGYFPDYKSERAFVHKSKERIAAIARLIQQRSMYGNVFALVDNIEFGKALSAAIEGSVFLYGKNGVEERAEVYKQFADRNDMIVIANAKIASTGLSIDRINELFLVDLGKSFIKIIQSIGRGLRMSKDKQHVNIHDVGTDLPYGHKHALERIRHYVEAQYPYKKVKVDYSKFDQL